MAVTLIISPLAVFIGHPEIRQQPFRHLVNYWLSLRGVKGPVWYLAVLLSFDILLALAVYVFGAERALPPNSPRLWTWNRFHLMVILCLALDITTSFLIRLWWPIGTIFVPFELLMGYLPQYILAYIVGIHFASLQPFFLHAYTQGPVSHQHPWRALFFRYIMAIAVLAVHGVVFKERAMELLGGWNLPALVYAVWNEVFFYLLGSAWLSLYFYGSSQYSGAKRWERALLDPGRLFPARYSYAAYLLHIIPVTAAQVFVATAMGSSGTQRMGSLLVSSDLGGLCEAKTFISGMLGLVGTWALGWMVVVWVPGVGRII
jgi:glucans biosynthesis protein C